MSERRDYLREQQKRDNASQQRQIQAQEHETDSLRQDIGNITKLQRVVQRLMDDMLNGLERIVAAGLP